MAVQQVGNNTLHERSDRVVIEAVAPEIDGGRFPIKRTRGESVVVEADILVDGHEVISAVLLFRGEQELQWCEVPMIPLMNDRWRGTFVANEIGRYVYGLSAWVDPFKSWRRDLRKKADANAHTDVDMLTGALLVEEACQRAAPADARKLAAWAMLLSAKNESLAEKIAHGLSDELAAVMVSYPDRRFATTYDKQLVVVVDREKARFSAWYEMFPRSCAAQAGAHGTFKDCEGLLPYVASMGFDVLYLPPIHPIGRTNRKGKNNLVSNGVDDPGSPWAIGAETGGHKAIHPELGTIEDFRRLVKKAESLGIEVALDLAFQCSPDHPYVKAHPQWFRRRPDGTVQHAENPPKNYQDIYPLDFTSEQWREIWQELRSVVGYWIEQGVHIFRVDNPHTKPMPFWQWLIDNVKQGHPEIIFLSEAFTRPKVMYNLAKLGFSQSYTYFTWRNTKPELTQYFKELAQPELREYFRPSLWPNTPDILSEYLQLGGRPAFMTRCVLAATLGANYGIYGPAFELLEARPRDPGGEEYLDSEKYQIKQWNRDSADSLKDFITRLNRIRRENPALQSDGRLRFHETDNEQILCYTKQSEDGDNMIAVVVNLDPHHVQSGWVTIPAETIDLKPLDSYQAHDLLTGARFLWHGASNYVELDPRIVPAHIFRLRRHVRREQDFDYFM
jgi:starch synthase (maltosyl-transferring)